MRPKALALSASLVACVASLRAPLAAAEDAAKPPTPVSIGIHVISLSNVDVRAMTFDADFYLWLRWPEERSTPGDPRRSAQIEFMNVVGAPPSMVRADEHALSDSKDTGPGAREDYVWWRVRGTFSFRPDVARYPFDVQTLAIHVEHADQESDDVRFVDDMCAGSLSGDSVGIHPDVSLPGFHRAQTKHGVTDTVYPTNFGSPKSRRRAESARTKAEGDAHRALRYSRFSLEMTFRREAAPHVFKTAASILLILFAAFFAFWVAASDVSRAYGIVATALLALVASNLSLGQALPGSGFPVMSDWWYVAAYGILVFQMFALTWIHTRPVGDQPKTARLGRIVFGGVVLVSVAVAAGLAVAP